MKRDRSIDFAAGLMIVSMILMHIRFFSGTKICSILTDLFPFYMAWFFFKSGMFHKERDYKEQAKNGFNKLIRPFLIYSMVGIVLYLLLYDDMNVKLFVKEFVMLGSFPGSQHLWFLLSLFFATFLFKATKDHWSAILLLAIVLVLFHYNSKNHIVGFPVFGDIPYIWGNIISGCLFMYCGYRLKEFQYHRWVFITSLVLYVIMFITCYSNVDMRTNSVLKGGLQWYPFSLFGIIALNNLSKFISECVVSRPLIYIGRHSLTFYIYHWFVILGVCIICKWLKIDVAAYMLILANLIVLPLVVVFQKHCAIKKSYK